MISIISIFPPGQHFPEMLKRKSFRTDRFLT